MFLSSSRKLINFALSSVALAGNSQFFSLKLAKAVLKKITPDNNHTYNLIRLTAVKLPLFGCCFLCRLNDNFIAYKLENNLTS